MIYSRIDPNIKIRKADDLYEPPQKVYVTAFNEVSSKKFIEDMDKAENINQPVIPIIIDSYGGAVYSLLAMLDRINVCTKPVATIAIGKAMSCGSVLLSAGKEGMRYISPNATVMIHEVASAGWGKVEEVKANAEEANRLNKLILEKMSTNCGKNPNHFMNIIHEKNHADWFLTAEEVIEHNLANKIHIPSFEVKVSLEVSFK